MKPLKSLFLKYRTNLITIFSILLIGIAVINIYYSVAVNVRSNDECIWEPIKDSTVIYFRLVKVGGVTWNAGIRDGDQLVEIAGIPVENVFQAQSILDKFEYGDYAEYKYLRDGKLYTTKVFIKKLVQFGSLAGALTALFWILIGFIVLSAKPDGRVHRYFYFIAVLAVFTSFNVHLPIYGDYFNYFQRTGFTGLIILFFFLAGVSYSPFLLNYFFWNFPAQFSFARKSWVRKTMIIIPSIVLLSMTILFVLTYFRLINERSFLIFEYFYYFITLANVAAFIALVVQYKKIQSKEKRKPILLMLIAMAFGFAVTIYVARIAPAISDTLFNSPEYYMPIILIAVVPLVFAYAIFKYQLMDVSVVVKNTIIYGTATATVAIIYFFVIYVAGQSISSFLGVENQGIIAGVFFIIFAFVFQSTKDKFQDFITKRFYPEQFAHQKVLVDLSNELSTAVGLDKIIRLLKNSFVDALKIKTFGIMMREKDGTLGLVDSVGMSNEKCVILETRIAQFLKEKFLITKYPSIEQADFKVVFPDAKAERLISEGVYTIIPMMVKSKIVGLLLFGLKHSGSHFAGKDLELLWAAANQAAISIENARLYKSEVEKQKIERDLDLARRIQQGLLPQCIPDMNGLDICGEMIPAMQVGGDYFDLIQISDSKLFVVVGDVSGKGLSASLYMTKLQTMIKLNCTEDKSPKEILIDVNRRIYEEIDRSSFVTITLALFDLNKRTLKFCRAGHMPVLMATNGTVQSYRTQGLGVGIEKGIVFEKSLVEEEVKLSPGQIYAFFTDGVTEAMNENNELFGDENLNAILKNKSEARSSDILYEIWSSINSFRGNAEVNDDMTMVVVKVK